MRVGLGYQATSSSIPTLTESIEVTSVEEALQWVSQFVEPIQQIELTNGWCRIAHTTTSEYFLVV